MDKEALLEDDWLTDRHINALNKLLSEQFPSINGLQSPLVLGEFFAYNSSNQDFIQIVNITRQHWVCVANVISSPGIVEVYDSKPAFSISSYSLRKQVAAIMKTDSKSFMLHHVDVQRQVGANDCALFAMAFATTLCQYDDPHAHSYVQGSMRSHLAKCFINHEILPFAEVHKRSRIRKRIIQRKRVDVFCMCRLPWDRGDDGKGTLVQCYSCKEWYHEVCLNIDKRLIDAPQLKYTCNICLNI